MCVVTTPFQVLPADALEGENAVFSLAVVQLERVLFGSGSVILSQCTAEVAHFSLQWWTEPSALKHQSSPQGEENLQLHRQLECIKNLWKYCSDGLLPPPFCPQHTPSSALSCQRPVSWVLTPSLCALISTSSLTMSHTLWVCPVTTSSTSPTPGTMGNTTGAVPWWTSTRPSRCRQGPCPTTTGLPSRSAKSAGFYITLMQMEIAVSCSLALKCTWIDVLKSKAVYSVCTIHSDHLALLRAQQLLLVRLQKMALEQKDFRKKVGGLLFLKHMSVSVKGYCCTFPLSLQFLKKPSARVRLVKAVDPSCRGIGSSQAVVYTLSKRKFLA